MTLQDRIDNYHKETGFPNSLFLGGDGRIAGIFIMGNDYRVKSGYHGGYPPTYLRRMKALFPDMGVVLHLFSGQVDYAPFHDKSTFQLSVDINPENKPDYVDDAQTLTKVPLEEVQLVLADPPYTESDANKYGTTMVKRNLVMRSLQRIRKGTFVVWLDQTLPMYTKLHWEIVGHIGMIRSTNHRFRVITIFRRK